MIRLSGVVKEYARSWRTRSNRVRALDGVDLEVPPGSAVGLVGLNGAGKSTLIRVLLGYARPSSGEATIDGLPPRRYIETRGVAYVPERVAIPREWTVEHALRAFAMLGEVPGDAWSRVEQALDRMGLRSLAKVRIAKLSKGNVQRVAIAQALLPERSVMVLDEPTDGLDPVWVAHFREQLAEWRAAEPNRILILASHNLPEVEKLADRVLLLHNGRLEGELRRDGRTLEDALLERVRALPEPRA